MKKLKNIYACRMLLGVILASLADDLIISILIGLILLFFSYRECLLYILMLSLILSFNSINIDYIPIGVVERKIDNYYIVDKLLYKTKTYDKLEIGDILLHGDSKITDDKNNIRKNIKFDSFDFDVIYNLKFKKVIYDRVNSFEINTKTCLNKFLYNINNYDDLSFNVGYGLAIYYLIKQIYDRKKAIGITILILFSIIFYFDVKFYLITIDFIIDNLNLERLNRYLLKIITILIINKCLIFNLSILIPLLLELYRYLDAKIGFKAYFSLIESVFFGRINILSILIYKYYIKLQVLILISSLIVLLIPKTLFIYNFLIQIYNYINEADFSIRGSFSILSYITLKLIISFFNINNKTFIFLTILALLSSPFNNPFMHVSFIDVGQGDATLIKLPFNRGNILIDTGSRYNYYKLSKYLDKQGIYNIDYLIITHDDSDHNGNIDSLRKDYRIENLVKEGKDIEINDFKLQYLYLGSFDNDNDNSLVYYTNVNGIKFLLTGDISSQAERKMINENGNIHIDVLKVSHHGSNTGSSDGFISSTLPQFSIISTSGQYNHPSTETLETLNKYLSKVFITKLDGNVEIYITKILSFLKTSNWDFVIIRS